MPQVILWGEINHLWHCCVSGDSNELLVIACYLFVLYMSKRLTPADLRRKVGLTQEEVATALGRSLSTVSKWEQFSSRPKLTLVEVKKMLLTYDCDIDELIEVFERVNPDEVTVRLPETH